MLQLLDALAGLVALALAARLWQLWRTRPRPIRPAWWTEPDEIGRTLERARNRRPRRRWIIGLPLPVIRQFCGGEDDARPADTPLGHVNGHDRDVQSPFPRQRPPRW